MKKDLRISAGRSEQMCKMAEETWSEESGGDELHTLLWSGQKASLAFATGLNLKKKRKIKILPKYRSVLSETKQNKKGLKWEELLPKRGSSLGSSQDVVLFLWFM